MDIYKRKIKYFGVILGLILLLTNQVNAQETTSYSWSDSIKEGDKFTWKIESIIQSNEYLNEENYTLSALQTNTTTQPNNNVTTTNIETVTIETEITTEQGYDPHEFKNGSIISLEILKDLGPLSLDDPLLDSEWYDESSPVYEYFEYLIDGKINYYLLPLPIMIVPVEVHNGYADNFFDHELLLDDDGNLGNANKTIVDGVFSLNVNQLDQDNFSSSESVANVSWDAETGLLLDLELISHYSDEYSIGHYEMKLSILEISHNEPNTELEIPVSVISVFSVLLIPIINKFRKNNKY